MQTYTQAFSSDGTWELNTPGRYFILLGCTLTVNVRLYEGGRRLDFGEIRNVLAGLEVGGHNEGTYFDRVQIDVQAGDTVTIGIGNGQVRYNRANGTVDVNTNAPTRATVAQTAVTVTNAASSIAAANNARKYLLIQNKDLTGNVWLNFAGTATTANGIKVVPGGFFSLDAGAVITQAISAIGDIASNDNVLVVEG